MIYTGNVYSLTGRLSMYRWSKSQHQHHPLSIGLTYRKDMLNT